MSTVLRTLGLSRNRPRVQRAWLRQSQRREYVRAFFWHTNTVENYFSILKRGIIGVYHHVSEIHLHRYGAEFEFRYKHRIRLGYSDMDRAEKIATGMHGKRLTYRRPSERPNV
jgi:hypothetical protein